LNGVADSVEIYLREAGRVDIKERSALEERMRKEDYQVKNRLAKTYLKFVIFIAKKYMGKGVEFLDLIQAGNMGLLFAIEKSDWQERRYKFINYAEWWVKTYIKKEILEQSKPILYKQFAVFTISKYFEAIHNLSQKLKKYPSINEIANEMGISEDKVNKIKRINMNRQEPVSLETLVGERDDLGDFIKDKAPTPFEIAFRAILKEQFKGALRILTHIEKRVIELRYGLSGYRPHTIIEIAKEFGFHECSVHKIRSRALNKLRHPSRSRELEDYLD
jgi:RNA polymerase primary sigma factor